jgi:hypothetical protein
MGDENLIYGMLDLVEESMELIGASLFFETLIGHLIALGGEGSGKTLPPTSTS